MLMLSEPLGSSVPIMTELWFLLRLRPRSRPAQRVDPDCRVGSLATTICDISSVPSNCGPYRARTDDIHGVNATDKGGTAIAEVSPVACVA
jgi:hypothetical protein